MRTQRGITRLGIAGLAAAALVATAMPALAATGSGSTPTFTVTYTVGDVVFDGPGCVQVPFGIDYALGGAPNGYVTLDLGFAKSNAPVSGSIIVTGQDPATGTKTSEMTYCPANFIAGKGPLRVTGTVVSPRGGATAQVTPSTATVVQNPVRMSRPRAKQSAGNWTIGGVAEARTKSRGWVGAGGTVTIQLKRAGSSRWVSGETVALDQFGAWKTLVPIPTATYRPGTSVRALLTGCNWCKNASTTGTLR